MPWPSFAAIALLGSLCLAATAATSSESFGSALQGPQMAASQVREIGLLIADKREGAFALTVDWMAVE